MLSDNPILYREWLNLRRRRKETWLRRLTYPAMILTPTLGIFVLGSFDRYGPSLRDAGEVGFALTVLMHCLYVTLRAIASTVSTVAWERENRTYDVLTTTPMHPASLLFGKLLATQLPLTAEMLIFSPLWLFFVVVRAGHLSQLAEVAAMTVGLQVVFSSLGLWASLARPSAEQAGRLVYSILAAITLGDSFLFLVLKTARGWEDAPLWSQSINPFFAAGSIFWGGPELWLWFTVIALAVSPIFLYNALQRFSRPGAAAGRRRVRPLLQPGPEAPVAYRSWLSRRRIGFSASAWLLYPAFVLGPAVCMDGFSSHLDSIQEASLFLGLIAHILFFSVLALARASSLVSRERERGNWESLVGSLQTGRELYRAQLASVLGPLYTQLAWCTPILAAFLLVGGITLPGLVGVVLLTAGSIYFWANLGLMVSHRSPTSWRSLQLAIGLLMALLVTPLVIDLTVSLVLSREVLFFSYSNPVLAVLTFTRELSRNGRELLGPVCIVGYLAAGCWLARRNQRDFVRASRA